MLTQHFASITCSQENNQNNPESHKHGTDSVINNDRAAGGEHDMTEQEKNK